MRRIALNLPDEDAEALDEVVASREDRNVTSELRLAVRTWIRFRRGEIEVVDEDGFKMSRDV